MEEKASFSRGTYEAMGQRVMRFLKAMRNPTKRAGLTGISNTIIRVDGGNTKPVGLSIHVDDEGDVQGYPPTQEELDNQSESEPQ